MPEPTDRETYEPEERLCEVCGDPFLVDETATRACPGCTDWSDVEEFMF